MFLMKTGFFFSEWQKITLGPCYTTWRVTETKLILPKTEVSCLLSPSVAWKHDAARVQRPSEGWVVYFEQRALKVMLSQGSEFEPWVVTTMCLRSWSLGTQWSVSAFLDSPLTTCVNSSSYQYLYELGLQQSGTHACITNSKLAVKKHLAVK